MQDDMKIAREEIFGPVQTILKFRYASDFFRFSCGTQRVG